MLSSAAVASLNSTQVSFFGYISPSSCGGIQTNIMSNLPDSAQGGWSQSCTALLSVKNACPFVRLFNFSASGISGLTPECVSAIPSVQFTSLSSTQVASFSEGCSGLTIDQLSTVSDDLFPFWVGRCVFLMPDTYFSDNITLQRTLLLSPAGGGGLFPPKLWNLTFRFGLDFLDRALTLLSVPSLNQSAVFVETIGKGPDLNATLACSANAGTTNWLRVALSKDYSCFTHLNVNSVANSTTEGLRAGLISDTLQDDVLAAMDPLHIAHLTCLGVKDVDVTLIQPSNFPFFNWYFAKNPYSTTLEQLLWQGNNYYEYLQGVPCTLIHDAPETWFQNVFLAGIAPYDSGLLKSKVTKFRNNACPEPGDFLECLGKKKHTFFSDFCFCFTRSISACQILLWLERQELSGFTSTWCDQINNDSYRTNDAARERSASFSRGYCWHCCWLTGWSRIDCFNRSFRRQKEQIKSWIHSTMKNMVFS